MINPITDIIQSAIAPVLGIVDKFVTDKDQAAQLKFQISNSLIGLDAKILESQTKAIVAEAQGESWMQRNWRPTQSHLKRARVGCIDSFQITFAFYPLHTKMRPSRPHENVLRFSFEKVGEVYIIASQMSRSIFQNRIRMRGKTYGNRRFEYPIKGCLNAGLFNHLLKKLHKPTKSIKH